MLKILLNKKFLIFNSILYAFLFMGFNYSNQSNLLIKDYSDILAREKKIYLDGIGGAMCNDLQWIFASYTSNRLITLDEAKRLYVEIVEEYIKKLNNNKSIRPYLHNYPCTFKNVHLMIDFVDENDHFIGDGYVSLIFLNDKKDEVVFNGHNGKDFYFLHKEHYLNLLQSLKKT